MPLSRKQLWALAKRIKFSGEEPSLMVEGTEFRVRKSKAVIFVARGWYEGAPIDVYPITVEDFNLGPYSSWVGLKEKYANAYHSAVRQLLGLKEGECLDEQVRQDCEECGGRFADSRHRLQCQKCRNLCGSQEALEPATPFDLERWNEGRFCVVRTHKAFRVAKKVGEGIVFAVDEQGAKRGFGTDYNRAYWAAALASANDWLHKQREHSHGSGHS